MLKLCILLFCVFLKETYGASAILKAVPKPPEFAGQEGCYDPNMKVVLGFGKTIDAPGCSQRRCADNGDIFISSCGLIGVSDGFTLVKGNLSLPYPQCCDHAEAVQKKP